MRLLYDPVIILLGSHPREIKASYKNLQTNTHSSFTCNGRMLKWIQRDDSQWVNGFTNCWMHKQNCTQLIDKDTLILMDIQGIMLTKVNPKSYILYDSTSTVFMKWQNVINGKMEGGRGKGYSYKGTRVPRPLFNILTGGRYWHYTSANTGWNLIHTETSTSKNWEILISLVYFTRRQYHDCSTIV